MGRFSGNLNFLEPFGHLGPVVGLIFTCQTKDTVRFSSWDSTRASERCYSHQQENKREYEYLGVSLAPQGFVVEDRVIVQSINHDYEGKDSFQIQGSRSPKRNV